MQGNAITRYHNNPRSCFSTNECDDCFPSTKFVFPDGSTKRIMTNGMERKAIAGSMVAIGQVGLNFMSLCQNLRKGINMPKEGA